jgi:hypothetical protein
MKVPSAVLQVYTSPALIGNTPYADANGLSTTPPNPHCHDIRRPERA